MRIFKKKDLVNKKEKKLNKVISEKSFTYAPLFKKIKKHIKGQPEILDAGCGEGNISLLLAKNNSRVWGIDISKEAIVSAKKKMKMLGLQNRVTFLIEDLERLTLNKKFDVVVCIEVLEHIKNDNQSIENLFSHLKNKGLAIITVPSKNAPLYRLKFIKKYDMEVGHLRRYDEKTLTNKLKRAGFEQIILEKTEGIFRNFLFFTSSGKLLLKFANRFLLISKIFEKIDCLFLKMFEGAQITAFAIKK